MAKRVLKLDFVDIVMGARADVIKEAYEARLKIDDLLDAREEAYKKIAEIEEKVEDIVGVTGDFIFPAPPLPVAGIARPTDSTRPKKVVQKAETLEEKIHVLKENTPDKNVKDEIEKMNSSESEEANNEPQSKEDVNKEDTPCSTTSAMDNKEDTPYSTGSTTPQDESVLIEDNKEDTPCSTGSTTPQDESVLIEDTPCNATSTTPQDKIDDTPSGESSDLPEKPE